MLRAFEVSIPMGTLLLELVVVRLVVGTVAQRTPIQVDFSQFQHLAVHSNQLHQLASSLDSEMFHKHVLPAIESENGEEFSLLINYDHFRCTKSVFLIKFLINRPSNIEFIDLSSQLIG